MKVLTGDASDSFREWLFSRTYLARSWLNMVTANPRIVTEAQTWRTFLTMSDDLTVNSLTLPEDAAVAPVTRVIQISTSVVTAIACS